MLPLESIEKAEPWYEKAITFDPKQCAFYYYLARAYAGERKFELAKKKLTLSLELAESKKWKRAVLRELGRIKEARTQETHLAAPAHNGKSPEEEDYFL